MNRRQAILSTLLAPFAFKRLVLTPPASRTIEVTRWVANPAFYSARYEMRFVSNWGNRTINFNGCSSQPPVITRRKP